MGPLHPQEPKLREVESYIKEAHGENRQRSQELLELATEEKNWLYATRCEPTFREEEEAKDPPDATIIAKWTISYRAAIPHQ